MNFQKQISHRKICLTMTMHILYGGYFCQLKRTPAKEKFTISGLVNFTLGFVQLSIGRCLLKGMIDKDESSNEIGKVQFGDVIKNRLYLS